MALREIIEASEHDADPVWVGSADIRHNIAQGRHSAAARMMTSPTSNRRSE
jgi:hypothetical protein